MADKKDTGKDKEIKATKDAGKSDETPEGGEAAADGGEGGKKKLGKKKIIIFAVLGLLLLIGGGGAAAYFTGALDKMLHKEIDCKAVKEGEPEFDECQKKLIASGEITKPSEFFEIPNLIVNLNSSSKQQRFLKISVKLELEDKSDMTKIEAIMPRVIDHFQTYLRELRVEDLRGSSGIYRLRMELLSRVNAAAPDIKVKDVLFQEILIQ